MIFRFQSLSWFQAYRWWRCMGGRWASGAWVGRQSCECLCTHDSATGSCCCHHRVLPGRSIHFGRECVPGCRAATCIMLDWNPLFIYLPSGNYSGGRGHVLCLVKQGMHSPCPPPLPRPQRRKKVCWTWGHGFSDEGLDANHVSPHLRSGSVTVTGQMATSQDHVLETPCDMNRKGQIEPYCPRATGWFMTLDQLNRLYEH